MENFALLFHGFQVVFTLQNIGACLLGAFLGLVVGAMPGIGSLAGVALLLPLTYKFNPTTAIVLLGALYYSNMYGGAFSAILLNIPGDSPAVMTALDGYPMATVRKRPGQALFTANLASCIGGTIGMLILAFLGPALADAGLHFGPAEMTILLLVAMTSIGWLVGSNPTNGVVLTLLGILIASIGMDLQSGSPRFNFGNVYLLGGVKFIPFVIGTVGFAQVMKLMDEKDEKAKESGITERLTIRGSLLSLHDVKRILPPAIRSGILGTFVGVLPGAGATTGAFLGYAVQRAFKNEEPLGTGAMEGIAACEAANNAAAAGAFAPLLALGIVRDHRFQPKNDHRFQPVQMSSNSTNIQNAVDSIFVSLSYLRQYGSVAEVHLSDYLVLSSVRLACKVEAIGSVEKTVQYALRKN